LENKKNVLERRIDNYFSKRAKIQNEKIKIENRKEIIKRLTENNRKMLDYYELKPIPLKIYLFKTKVKSFSCRR
jgi:hypothetical protein